MAFDDALGRGQRMTIVAKDPVGTARGARHSVPINGWCSWFYTLANVSEEELLRNVEFASQHLRPYGLDCIQIDEGYQRWHGEWEGNVRFPHGMGTRTMVSRAVLVRVIDFDQHDS